MASMSDIKRRIKSVGNTQQITKAMNLVSTSKLQRSKNKLISTRPFYNTVESIINNIINNSTNLDNPFIRKRNINKTLIVVITSNRGLCGGYNSNILKESINKIKDKKENVISIIIGSKGIEYFSDKGIKVKESFKDIPENISYEDANKISKIIIDLYLSNEVDEVLLAYTKFESTISYIPKVEQILPINNFNGQKDKDNKSKKQVMIYEPNQEEVLSYIIPLYINTFIFEALLESITCEQGARMTSMDSATKNAQDAIENMTIIYNRARQGAITQEITEIISGANAI